MAPSAVESAAALGARMVFLPTWGSCHDLRVQGHVIRNVFPQVYETFHVDQIVGTSFLDEQGQLTDRGRELVAYCHAHDLTLGTGHVSWDETFTLDMVEDELSLHERKAGQVLAPLERERLTQLWLALRSERYRDAA